MHSFFQVQIVLLCYCMFHVICMRLSCNGNVCNAKNEQNNCIYLHIHEKRTRPVKLSYKAEQLLEYYLK